MSDSRKRLEGYLEELGSVLVAYSGGVDSSLLLAVASNIPGLSCLGVFIDTPLVSRREEKAAMENACKWGATVRKLPLDPLSLPLIAENSRDRCYHCKHYLFEAISTLAESKGFMHLIHGANMDDLGDYRPGMKAAEELGFKAPFVECGISKAQIREMALEMGLEVWKKPASACLASRIPYGTPLTTYGLSRIEESEDFLQDLGFEGCRVRGHGDVARIEVPVPLMAKFSDPALCRTVSSGLKKSGFLFVALDLDGYATGSLNADAGN